MVINDYGQRSLVARSERGDISLPSDSVSTPLSDPDRAGAGSNGRAKRSPYSDEFEACWRQYGRKEEKVKAYARWKVEAKAAGGEDVLRDLVLKALAWQGPIWAADGWKFAKYFERYLKAHKWEDEPLPARRGPANTRQVGTVTSLRNFLAKETSDDR